MITPKQIRMLELLDEQIQSCEKCSLHENGRAKPFWTEESRYAICGEAPGSNEVTYNSPFVGEAGKNLWTVLERNALYRKDFLIINSTNCRPVKGNSNGKPTKIQLERCRPWIRKYLKVFQPEKILILGGYALFTLLGQDGITARNGELERMDEFNCYAYKSIHPAYIIYNRKEGIKKLEEAIQIFHEDIGI